MRDKWQLGWRQSPSVSQIANFEINQNAFKVLPTLFAITIAHVSFLDNVKLYLKSTLSHHRLLTQNHVSYQEYNMTWQFVYSFMKWYLLFNHCRRRRRRGLHHFFVGLLQFCMIGKLNKYFFKWITLKKG